MPKQAKTPVIHSLAEAYLYVRAARCATCGGALDADEAWFGYERERRVLRLEVACRLCEAAFDREFDASEVAEADFALLTNGTLAPPWDAESPVINHTDEASHVIDVAGWLTLLTLIQDRARSVGEQAEGSHDRQAARRMRLVAAACVEEALKFFEDDNDLPPDEAFFGDATRRQFWERPELFTRQHIAELRLSLAKAASDR